MLGECTRRDLLGAPPDFAEALRDRYLLERELGRGGMATVYLAQDVKHRRAVALKVLHPDLAAVLGSERFLKEIELTAHLQHPHILPLFDSGRVNGTVYYVMPFVSGESLRDRLRREKQLPVADALKVATEVASALDYAHRHDVIHRDIKPENILLLDGQALVADFGIALAASKAGGASRLTETGLSLGTPHYMSPEQAMGERELTLRSDVYALGAVVYEMLTGAPPFVGPTPQAVVARVLTETPRPLSSQRRSVPEHVEAAVLTALEKLPADRFATAAEFAAALAGDTPSARVRRASGKTAGRRTAGEGVWRRAAITGGALWLATAVVAAWAWRDRDRASPAAPTRRAVLAPAHGADPRDEDFAVSADGRTIVLREERGGQVLVRRIEHLDPVSVPGTAGATSLFLTRDGSRVGFLRERELTLQRLDGSEALTIPFPTAQFPSDAGDGRIVAVDSGALVLLEPGSRRRETVVHAPPGVAFLRPLIPAGGNHVLLTAVEKGRLASARILAVDLRSHAVDTLVGGGALHPQVADSRLYFARPDGTLQAVAYEVKTGRTTGQAVPTGDVAVVQRTGLAAFAAGAGLIVYGERTVNRVVVRTPAGGREVLTPEPGTYHNPRVSPDGRRIVLDREVRGQATRDVWVLDLAERALARVTSRGDGHDAVWHPDGRRVTYLSLGTPGGPLFTTATDGSGGDSAVALPGRVVHPGQWLADRKTYVAGVSNGAENDPSDVVAIQAADGSVEPLVASPYNEFSPAISPDGGWLAYVSDETGIRQVYLRPLRGSGRALVSEAEGEEPVWSRDGARLYYIERRPAGARLMAARVASGPAARVVSREVVLDPLHAESVANHANWDVSPDGRFIFVEPVAGNRFLMVSDWAPRGEPARR